MSATFSRLMAVAAATSVLLLAGCERPPMKTTQQGFRGTAMQSTVNPRIAAEQMAAVPAVPEDAPPAGTDGPKAKDVYQNVKVLGHLPLVEFNRHMNAITQWVAPKEGCTYCHAANFAEDSKYTKVVARRMIEMTQALNGQWKQHTGATGVTCYTCHRGNNVPENVWTTPVVAKLNKSTFIGNDFGQNKAAKNIGSTSLPYDPFSSYLAGDEAVGVYGKAALPTNGRGNGATIQQAEKTYALMIHATKALGVNCTFCHNSQAFSQWTPKKVTAWHGIRMARDINNTYMTPLTATFPANRLGPNGDVQKAFCATCHQGVNKPLGGLEMAKLYPGLQPLPAAPALPSPVAEASKSVLYFGVGSADLAGEQSKGLVQLVSTLGAQPKAVAFVSGYHSAAGELASNQELAKKRAFAVRDALVAAGIPEARVKLDKPQKAEANASGEDPASRRVEVKVQ